MLELHDAVDDELLGSIDLAGDTLTATGGAAEMVQARRRRGFSDPEIYDQLGGWSNGYVYFSPAASTRP